MPQGAQPYNIIPESDVYRLVMRSNLPDAERFQDWVVEEVLPSIRKTGGYGQWNLPRVPKSFPDALRMIADIEEEKQLALEQRDYYKRTKAEIGSRREATSMATASAAIRQRDALADKLGEGKHYKQVKAIPWLLEVFHESAGMYSQVGVASSRSLVKGWASLRASRKTANTAPSRSTMWKSSRHSGWLSSRTITCWGNIVSSSSASISPRRTAGIDRNKKAPSYRPMRA